MLSSYSPHATLPTGDPQRSREFYEGVLGFVGEDFGPGGEILYQCDGNGFMVYPSSFAGTNQATAVSFDVPFDAFDDEVAALRSAGVTFDTFEMEGVEWQDGVATMEGMKAVWFRDPDGNILNMDAMQS